MRSNCEVCGSHEWRRMQGRPVCLVCGQDLGPARRRCEEQECIACPEAGACRRPIAEEAFGEILLVHMMDAMKAVIEFKESANANKS